ncbi:MAG TPA: NUDIX hydrolase [Ktedonobacteraceae bacterium]|jgi:8-oxo-dGTP pyrophosphatase MutT (NUDIX family)|nr:NUDIX hydrolase [Ktedonobacteraceae bacterium]
MIPSLSPDIQDELSQLAGRYGQPIVRTIDLHGDHLFNPLNKHDRYGEVCMVVRRPDGHLLTMLKQFYPPEGYRLLTGGINHGEAIFDALLRETQEETGLEVKVQRFLAAAIYRLPQFRTEPVFYTFAFLLDEVGGTLGVIDTHEKVAGFREIMPQELPQMAETLEHIGANYSADIQGNWQNWGEFRAAIHRLVWEALTV